MDRGIPTEEVLTEMQQSETPIYYLVGTPKGRLNKLESQLLPLPWEKVRESLNVKLLKQDKELYVLACSNSRQAKERAMRRRRLKQYWNRLKELRSQKLNRDQLLMKIGAAKKQAGNASKLVELSFPAPHQAVTPDTFSFSLYKDKLRTIRRQEGQYLLRSNLIGENASTLWKYYIQLVEVEQAFKNLKSDLLCGRSIIKKIQNRGAHFCGVPVLLSSGDAAAEIEGSGSGFNRAIYPGEVCLNSTGGCSSADYGWQRASIATIYRTG